MPTPVDTFPDSIAPLIEVVVRSRASPEYIAQVCQEDDIRPLELLVNDKSVRFVDRDAAYAVIARRRYVPPPEPVEAPKGARSPRARKRKTSVAPWVERLAKQESALTKLREQIATIQRVQREGAQ